MRTGMSVALLGTALLHSNKAERGEIFGLFVND